MTKLAIQQEIALELTDLVESAKAFAEASMAESTRRVYRQVFRDWEHWCRTIGQPALPASPQAVILWATHLATVRQQRFATIQKKLAVVSQAHQLAKQPNPVRTPEVRATMRGIANTITVRQEGKEPLLTEQIRLMVECIPETTKGLRDKAMLLLGFAFGARRSELVSVRV